MKSAVLREKLKEGLSVAERVCAKSPSLPILSNILLSAGKNFLQLSATDLEVGIRFAILAKNEQEGSLAVSPKPVNQFVGLLKDPQLTLSSKNNQLEIASKEFRANFKALNPEDFPIIPSAKGNEEFLEVETRPLVGGLSSVIGFTGQTQARPEISGVLFSFQKNTLKLASTDSFRLAEKTLHFKKETGAERSFILPQKAARELVSVLGERIGKTKIFFSPSQAIFDYASEGEPQEPKIQLVSRLIEGEYPQYQEVIPTSFVTTAKVQREELLNHLRAASVFAGRVLDARLTFDPAKKRIEVHAQSAEVGENTSFVPARISGEKTSIAFNWRFLGDGVAQFTAEDLEILLSGEDGPALLKSTQEDEGFLYVIMPIKT